MRSSVAAPACTVSNRVAERYVRPPLIAREAPSHRLAVWRYRLISFVLLLLIVAALVYTLIKALGIGQEDPGFGSGLRPPVTLVLSAAR